MATLSVWFAFYHPEHGGVPINRINALKKWKREAPQRAALNHKSDAAKHFFTMQPISQKLILLEALSFYPLGPWVRGLFLGECLLKITFGPFKYLTLAARVEFPWWRAALLIRGWRAALKRMAPQRGAKMICEISPRCGSHTPCKINSSHLACCTGDYGDVIGIHNANIRIYQRSAPAQRFSVQLGAGKQISTYNPSTRRSISISLSPSRSHLAPNWIFATRSPLLDFWMLRRARGVELPLLLFAHVSWYAPVSDTWLSLSVFSSRHRGEKYTLRAHDGSMRKLAFE